MYNQLYTRIGKAAKLTIPRSKILFLRRQREPPLPGKKRNVILTFGSRINNHNNNSKTE
jgi:hypothetical protein